MKKLISLLLVIAGLSVQPVAAHLDGILPLAKDEAAALSSIANSSRHVMIYFGDHAN